MEYNSFQTPSYSLSSSSFFRIYPIMYYFSLFLSLVLLQPIYVQAVCRSVGQAYCDTNCTDTTSCTVTENNKPKCPTGQRRNEIDLNKPGCAVLSRCKNVPGDFDFRCNYAYECVRSLYLNSFLGLSLTKQKLTSSSVRDDAICTQELG